MLTIRQARGSDCEAMCAMQRAAIARYYARSLGQEGAAARAQKVNAATMERTLDAAMVIVAEEAATLLGFAQFNAATGVVELTCRPDAEQRAIPAALLAVIETEARSRGLEKLKLSAMPDTEGMYAASGFVPTPLTAAGVNSLPAVRLEKRLAYSEPRPERRRNGTGKPSPTLT